MYLIVRWLLFAASIIFTAWLIPGITVSSFLAALVVCIVLGLINAFIRPVVMFISLPVNILTLGLFTLVVNALMLMIAGYFSPGFSVNGFWSAFFGSIVLAILGAFINRIDTHEAK